jgi:cation-transporting ATPase 13A1
MWAKKGYRLLALAYKDDNNNELNSHSKREDVEKDLIFCGFVIVETPLKKKTELYIKELVCAKYEVAIITGDHHLTTAKVAQDLEIGPKDIAFLKVIENSNNNKEIRFFDLDEKEINLINSKNFNEEKAHLELSSKYTIGITGKEMEKLDTNENIIKDKHKLFALIKLFCRVSPGQKDDIVKLLIKAGKNPSMCGDGSNDVGALKRAIIGIALLNSEETAEEKKQPFSIFSIEDESTIKSGDVTAAAPFTSKSGSMKCVKNIFIQGRCTLVITFQMFKILALNCLLSAYSLSILALKGVKYSDYQSTYMGFVVAFYFLMLSKAEPLKKLNQNKPPYTIFSISSIVSIIGQSITHLLSLYFILLLTSEYDAIKELESLKSLDDPFAPTLINTVMFIFSIVIQTNTFVANYQGEPFMQSIFNNKWMIRLSGLIVGLAVCVIFDLSPDLTLSLELLPLPEDSLYRIYFLGILIADFIICFIFENWKKIFGYYK